MDQARDPRYAASGVDSTKAEAGLTALRAWVERTFSLSPTSEPALPLGYFANVIRVEGLNLGIAISTDGVGTKILIAEMLDKYDTIGIDCIAMNVNDLLCVGATPISFVDYVAVETLAPPVLEALGRGLHRGAEISKINISGGEIAQLKELIRGVRRGSGLDLAGTAVGTVPLDKIIIGRDIKPNDVLIGFASSGIHSNGLSLAPEILLGDAGFTINSRLDDVSRTVGEELLEPTHIYVPEIVDLFQADVDIKALMHITGDGFLNLKRTEASVGFDIEVLPPSPPIFTTIQSCGGLTAAEMFQVFNMGVGLCLVVREEDTGTVLEIAAKHDVAAWRLGQAVKSPERRIRLGPHNLESVGDRFETIG